MYAQRMSTAPPMGSARSSHATRVAAKARASTFAGIRLSCEKGDEGWCSRKLSKDGRLSVHSVTFVLPPLGGCTRTPRRRISRELCATYHLI